MKEDLKKNERSYSDLYLLEMFCIVFSSKRLQQRKCAHVFMKMVCVFTFSIFYLFTKFNNHIYFVSIYSSSEQHYYIQISAIILRHYGAVGFFFVVASVLFLGGCVNRGAFISPLAPIELFFYQTIG